MTVPMDFAHASETFERFLREAVAQSGLATRHQAFTMTQAVLRVFRRRLDPAGALRFADALPVVLRALFVTEWDIGEAPVPFASREEMTAEVQGLRRDHNISPDSAIRDVAHALRSVVDARDFDATLARLPEGAVDFWRA